VDDDGRVEDEVRIVDVGPRPTVVVAATTTWQEFPTLWGALLGEVWRCLGARGIHGGCRNTMLYLDDRPHVEVGVLLDERGPFPGRVTASALPGGTAAMTVHRGPFTELGAAHGAVLRWCSAHGHRPTGVRWEIYGPHADDPARQWTEICWLVS
jgi:effector-binding domain-containing protein